MTRIRRLVSRRAVVAVGIAGLAAVAVPLAWSTASRPVSASPAASSSSTSEAPTSTSTTSTTAAPEPAPAPAPVVPALPPEPVRNREDNLVPTLLRTGSPDRPVVAITIDDLFGASGGDQLAQVLDIAEAKHVRLTLFPTGSALQDAIRNGQQEVWRRAVRDGDEIGNHTYSHANVTRLSDRQLQDEIARTQDKLNEVLGPGYDYRMRLFRPPGGAGGFEAKGNSRVMANLGRLGYSMAMWTIDSNYTNGFDSYVTKIMDPGPGGARAGSVILTHLTTISPVDIGHLIDRLRAEKNLEPTTMSELYGTPLPTDLVDQIDRLRVDPPSG